MLTRRRLATCCAVALALVPGLSGAVTLEGHDSRLSINGYLDLQYTYMGRLPRGREVSPGVFALDPVPQDGISTLGQDRLNLILRVDRDRFRANVNLYSNRGFRSDSRATQGHFEVMEAYGEYRRSEALNVRGGSFLAPFGNYNEIRFAISLFAPVVLPTVYEPLENYAESGGLDHVVPDEGNLMVSGAVGPLDRSLAYALYVGSGDRNAGGMDRNEDKALGGQLTARLNGGRQNLGVSYYTTDDDDRWGRRHHVMLSTDLRAGRTGLEAEALWVTTATDAADLFAYYVRLSREVGKATPFVGLDDFRDRANPIYADGMKRWSAGVGYEATSTVYLKAEYHFHTFDGNAVPSTADRVHMVRLAAIMVF